jgi:hypothetical protein
MRLGRSMVIYITADQNFDFVKNVNEFFKGVFLSFGGDYRAPTSFIVCWWVPLILYLLTYSEC